MTHWTRFVASLGFCGVNLIMCQQQQQQQTLSAGCNLKFPQWKPSVSWSLVSIRGSALAVITVVCSNCFAWIWTQLQTDYKWTKWINSISPGKLEQQLLAITSPNSLKDCFGFVFWLRCKHLNVGLVNIWRNLIMLKEKRTTGLLRDHDGPRPPVVDLHSDNMSPQVCCDGDESPEELRPNSW